MDALCGPHSKARLGKQEQCSRSLTRTFGEQRIFLTHPLERYDSMWVHPAMDFGDDLGRNPRGLRSEVHHVLHATRAGERPR